MLAVLSYAIQLSTMLRMSTSSTLRGTTISSRYLVYLVEVLSRDAYILASWNR